MLSRETNTTCQDKHLVLLTIDGGFNLCFNRGVRIEDELTSASTAPGSLYNRSRRTRDLKLIEELAHMCGGLTTEQKENIEIMEGLQKKYPKAFEEIVDDKERKILILDNEVVLVTQFSLGKLVISQGGIFGLNHDLLGLNNIDYTRLIDEAESVDNESGESPRLSPF